MRALGSLFAQTTLDKRINKLRGISGGGDRRKHNDRESATAAISSAAIKADK